MQRLGEASSVCHSERSVAESNFRGSKPEGGASESARQSRSGIYLRLLITLRNIKNISLCMEGLCYREVDPYGATRLGFACSLRSTRETSTPLRSAQDDTLKIGGVFNALKTGGSYCYGCELKLPSSLQSTSVAENGGLADKTFYQKVFWLLFFKKVTASYALNYNLSVR